MEEAMPEPLDIAITSERTDEGSPEERATFGLFTVRAHSASLTEGFDSYLNGSREGPLVAGSHIAEWIAWNWWRLRWEGRSASPDWPRAHQMASIGEGFLWPNITIFSDGVRTALISKPSSQSDSKPFRFVGALPTVVVSTAWESAVDAFMPQILGRLDSLGRTNLARLWDDVLAERSDPETAKRRRLEALLGRDPADSDDAEIDRLLVDEGRFGEEALGEVAADYAQAARPEAPLMTADVLEEIAQRRGHETAPRQAVRLNDRSHLPRVTEAPAWALGAAAARSLREQEALGGAPIANDRLARYAAVDERALDPTAGGAEMSFALEESEKRARLVLRSKWQTGRRFELARLIGDRLISAEEVLRPATRAHTYRQQAQRSFAAELLAPFDAVDDFMRGDYSDEAQSDAADHFAVSPMAINTLLKNHRRLPRDPFEDIELAA
jgi:hypothetical protein